MNTLTPSEHPSGPERLATIAAAFRGSADGFPRWGAPLYGALCARIAEDPGILELAGEGQERGEPFHLLVVVHYLLMRDPRHPLARYYPSLTENAAPLEEAFSEFASFCAAHRDEIRRLLATRTVQQTHVERCNKIIPAVAHVAQQVGEPLNLIELGCAAGVLLTMDKYAYDLRGRGKIGPADAPLALSFELRGGPELRIPKIGTRIGLDLYPADVRAEDERRWIMAQTYPEARVERASLAVSLDVVAQTEMRLYKGDALEHLPRALAETPDPVCVFHSACLMYWSPSSKIALDELLRDAGRRRDIYRVGAEPPEDFLHSQTEEDGTPKPQAEITITHYHKGNMEKRVVAHSDANSTFFHWLS